MENRQGFSSVVTESTQACVPSVLFAIQRTLGSWVPLCSFNYLVHAMLELLLGMLAKRPFADHALVIG